MCLDFLIELFLACSIEALLTDRNISLPELIYQNTTISRREVNNYQCCSSRFIFLEISFYIVTSSCVYIFLIMFM
jgi:hypothetical protein